MNLPAHPSNTDDTAVVSTSRRRVVIGVIALVVVLAGLHLLRTALG